MKLKLILISITMSILACSQQPTKNLPDPKTEITELMYKFQDLLNNSGFTYTYVLASTEPDNLFVDEKYYLKAIEEGKIDENTNLLDYAFNKIIVSDLLSDEFKGRLKVNYENGLSFSIWKDYVTIGAILTNSDFGLDFTGPLIKKQYENRDQFILGVVDSERYKNGFSPNPDSIISAYDNSIKEIYKHFIEVSSDKTASYYINYKLLKRYGTSPRFVMDFVLSENKGWQINNMYFDDYEGNILKNNVDYDKY